MNCKKCGNLLEEGATICPVCGEAVEINVNNADLQDVAKEALAALNLNNISSESIVEKKEEPISFEATPVDATPIEPVPFEASPIETPSVEPINPVSEEVPVNNVIEEVTPQNTSIEEVAPQNNTTMEQKVNDAPKAKGGSITTVLAILLILALLVIVYLTLRLANIL